MNPHCRIGWVHVKAGGARVRALRGGKDERPVNPSALAYAQELLERVQSGEVVVVATAEVRADGAVMTGWSRMGDHYHLVNSAAALLASRVVNSEGDGSEGAGA